MAGVQDDAGKTMLCIRMNGLDLCSLSRRILPAQSGRLAECLRQRESLTGWLGCRDRAIRAERCSLHQTETTWTTPWRENQMGIKGHARNAFAGWAVNLRRQFYSPRSPRR